MVGLVRYLKGWSNNKETKTEDCSKKEKYKMGLRFFGLPIMTGVGKAG
jgi:hypothetical protein